jgi:Mycobacterium membrane protein
VRDVEPARSDVAIERGQDASQPSDGRRVFLRRTRQGSSAPQAQNGSGKGRRNLRAVFLRVLRRLWIPLVILVVVAAGGLTVSRLHGLFGSEKSPSYADTQKDEAKPYNSQHMRYEVFGPPGTVAVISYFGPNADPQHADGVSLPWSVEFAINAATSIGSVAAQGDSDTIGCRILVDGVVKDEKVAHHEASAFTSCTLKAA